MTAFLIIVAVVAWIAFAVWVSHKIMTGYAFWLTLVFGVIGAVLAALISIDAQVYTLVSKSVSEGLKTANTKEEAE